MLIRVIWIVSKVQALCQRSASFIARKRVSLNMCVLPAFALISTLLSSYLIHNIVNKAIFRAGKEESKQNEDILASRPFNYKSTLVMGGAG